jgi:hypothetical protein
VKYHQAHAPAEVGLAKLAQMRGGHWSVEQSFQAAKGECGLDEYETRGWVGWHHHTALSLLALWFLTLQRQRWGKKEPQLMVPEVRALLVHLLDVRRWPEEEILHGSAWRQERNRSAKEGHRKRRQAEWARRRKC